MEHGFPLRIYIPDVYGMKQPKWIESIDATDHWEPGYWVVRGWDEVARMKATSVIDTVAADATGHRRRGADARPHWWDRPRGSPGNLQSRDPGRRRPVAGGSPAHPAVGSDVGPLAVRLAIPSRCPPIHRPLLRRQRHTSDRRAQSPGTQRRHGTEQQDSEALQACVRSQVFLGGSASAAWRWRIHDTQDHRQGLWP